MGEVRIESSWKAVLADEFSKPYFTDVSRMVRTAYPHTQVFPRPEHIFAAFAAAPFSSVRVVLLGQDPYHGTAILDGKEIPQAHGLCFSVRDGVPPPPSLQNILKEVARDMGRKVNVHTDLTRWATQGVLLLNSVLTVEKGKAGSHAGKGWETFTDAVIHAVSEQKTGVVFLLWGNYARAKRALIDTSKHLVLEAAHPSPLSAHAGFMGCSHFSKTNEYLVAHGGVPIEW